jgi:2-iminobutanoate/2-iminopropanoate deaminase
MSRSILASEHLPKASPYFSHAVKAAGLVFVSGTGPYSPETGTMVGDTIQEQTAQALRNISAILSAAGTSLDRVDVCNQFGGTPSTTPKWRSWSETIGA